MKALRAISLACLAQLSFGTASAQSSSWVYEETPNPLTDEVSYRAITVSNANVHMHVGCTDRAFYVAAQTGPFDVELGETREVIWRIDSEQAVSQAWDNLKAGAAVFDGDAIKLADAMKRASSRIVVRSGRATHQFSADGSTAAISKLMEKCPNPVLD